MGEEQQQKGFDWSDWGGMQPRQGCGCGCYLLIILAVGILIWAVRKSPEPAPAPAATAPVIPEDEDHDHPVELTRRPGPFSLDNLTVNDLRAAKRAVLHYQGIGLQCGGQYVSHATLNRVPLGSIPGAGGREGQGVWSDAALELTAEAVAALDEWNHLKIENPGRDSFKIARFWIELELADGRKACSQVTTTVYTQPPEWPYAEGTLVPFDQPIELEIRFGLVAGPRKNM